MPDREGDTASLPVPPPPRVPGICLYMIAERLADAVWKALHDEAEDNEDTDEEEEADA